MICFGLKNKLELSTFEHNGRESAIGKKAALCSFAALYQLEVSSEHGWLLLDQVILSEDLNSLTCWFPAGTQKLIANQEFMWMALFICLFERLFKKS